jgi:hypothetical protein
MTAWEGSSSRRFPRSRRGGDWSGTARLTGGHLDEQVLPDGRRWLVRRIAGAGAVKTYRCPGCEQPITAGSPHVVAWLPERSDERRHWHSPCWRRATNA